jgi:fructoselysine-6-P-deglycase FrlB-like protein
MSSVAAALCVLLVSFNASARVVVYTSRPGDTPESIAADY